MLKEYFSSFAKTVMQAVQKYEEKVEEEKQENIKLNLEKLSRIITRSEREKNQARDAL